MSWTNLAEDAPDDVEACVKVLSRALGRDAADRIMKFSTCQRCWELCVPGSVCRVPHSKLQREVISSYRKRNRTYSYCRCRACHGEHTVVFGEESEPMGVDRSKFCFEGNHTLSRPREGDLRQCIPSAVSLCQQPYLQSQLDSLPDYISSLSVSRCGAGARCSHLVGTAYQGVLGLSCALPNLLAFSSDLANFEPSLGFAEMPQLERIWVEGTVLWDKFLLFNLKRLYLGRCDTNNCLPGMLSAATQLEVVILSEVYHIGVLKCASNALRNIYLKDIHDSFNITLWAPNLRSLVLPDGFGQNFAVEGCEFLRDHRLKPSLPTDYSTPALTVHRSNNIGKTVRDDLERHPNMEWGHVDWPLLTRSDWEIDVSNRS